jgi:Fe-Mn family superoxide dismutase
MHQHQPLSFAPEALSGISARTTEIHHGKLYAGYVTKRNEVESAMAELDKASANQIFSAWRGLKEGETFAANGMILHEVFFAILGGSGDATGTAVAAKITEQWGSFESFVTEFTATAMAARGWAILAYDPSDMKLHIFAADAQNQGGVWGATPLVPCDVYEHAYFIDFGSDRKAYIAAFLQNVNWQEVDRRFALVAR